MICLDQYRGKLLTAVNQNLRTIIAGADEEAIHRFRVGVKRLTALYRILDQVRPEVGAKRFLKPARRLSRSVSKVRDCHITLRLISELAEPGSSELASLQRAVYARIRNDYRAFVKLAQDTVRLPLRLATIRSMKLSESALLRHKPAVVQQLLSAISDISNDPAADQWHAARILLKRYHHTLDAYSECPGPRPDEKELNQIGMLENLLGDWHDRVIAIDILHSFGKLEKQAAPMIVELNRQEVLLLGSSRIYLHKFNRRQVAI